MIVEEFHMKQTGLVESFLGLNKDYTYKYNLKDLLDGSGTYWF